MRAIRATLCGALLLAAGGCYGGYAEAGYSVGYPYGYARAYPYPYSYRPYYGAYPYARGYPYYRGTTVRPYYYGAPAYRRAHPSYAYPRGYYAPRGYGSYGRPYYR